MFTTNHQVLFDRLSGIYAPLLFAKTLFAVPDIDHWSFLKALENKDNEAILNLERSFFLKSEDQQRKEYIIQTAASWHETHHFHQYCFAPAVRTLMGVYSHILWQGRILLLRYLLRGEKPTSNISSVIDRKLLAFLSLYMGFFNCSREAMKSSLTNPIVYEINVDDVKGNKFPAVKIQNRLLPLGLNGIIESWTWSFIKALIFDLYPKSYYLWYIATKSSNLYWKYNLLEDIIGEMFGDLFYALDPYNRYKLVSSIAISACCTNTVVQPGIFIDRNRWPGWALTKTIELVWKAKRIIIRKGCLDTELFCRVVAMNQSDISGYTYLEEWSLPNLQITTGPKINSAFLFMKDQYTKFHIEFIGMYLNDNSCMNNAEGYMECIFSKIWPRIPIAISRAPGSKFFHLNFTNGQHNEWFDWLLLSQLIVNFYNGNVSCPLYRLNIGLKCDADIYCSDVAHIFHKRFCLLHSTIVSLQKP